MYFRTSTALHSAQTQQPRAAIRTRELTAHLAAAIATPRIQALMQLACVAHPQALEVCHG